MCPSKLLLASELRSVHRGVARLNIDELQRVGSREPPGIEAVVVLLGEIEAFPVEIDDADHSLGGLFDILATDIASGARRFRFFERRWQSPDKILFAIEPWCAKHPEATFDKALLDLFDTLRDNAKGN